MSADQVTTLNVAFDDYPQTLALKRGEVRSEPGRAQLHRHQAGQPVLQADGAGAEVRHQRDGDRDLSCRPRPSASRWCSCRRPSWAASSTAPSCTTRRAARSPRPIFPASASACAPTARPPVTWVRGILANDYGVDHRSHPLGHREDGHVAEYREPAGVERAAPDKNLLKMLRDGELDAAIYGADLPNDPTPQERDPRSRRGRGAMVRQAQGRADQPHGGGDRDAVEVQSGRGA